jgi:DNA-binding PadR family transcriptional regulator
MATSSRLSPEYVLLGLLAAAPEHGYALHRRLQSEFKAIWRISQSQCYSILKRLEASGYLISSPERPAARRGRSVLRLTPRGRAHFLAWLHSPTPGSARALRVAFVTRLHFALRLGRPLAEQMIDEQQARLGKDLSRLSALPTSALSELSRLSWQLKIRQLRACLEWLDDCRTTLDRPA